MGALTLSNAMTSKERDCDFRNFCLKFLLAYFHPVQLGFSGLYIYQRAGRPEISSA